jgi:pimeloyl-ACP methyl ester carboxylesterase
MQKHPVSIWDGPAVERAPEGDTWFWADARLSKAFYESLSEGLRQGTDGYRWEAIDVFLPWGFRLDEISIPVHIWYGVQDARFQGRGRELVDWIAGRIPHCVVVTWKDARHMGLVKHWDELVATFVRTPQSTGGLDSLQA